ncbi:MAG: FISUMP domain-containing protein, partial [Flavobacteriales bacterium]
FRNGDPIPQAKKEEEWVNADSKSQPAWCYNNFNNDPENGGKDVKLYNWHAVDDPRGLAPKGWHIPSEGEWTVLIDFLGGIEVAAIKMKSNNIWNFIGYGDENLGLWWSSTMAQEFIDRSAIYDDSGSEMDMPPMMILNGGYGLEMNNGNISQMGFDSGSQGAVRCLKD